jgi:hypothetical protein
MGTNYYLVKKLDPTEMTKAMSLLLNHDYAGVKDMLPEGEGVHIGKSSVGCEFTFDHNNWTYFNKSRASIEEFLKSGTIYCEYGAPISLEEFWEKVESKRGGRYSEEHLPRVDGLVFSKYTNFF